MFTQYIEAVLLLIVRFPRVTSIFIIYFITLHQQQQFVAVKKIMKYFSMAKPLLSLLK